MRAQQLELQAAAESTFEFHWRRWLAELQAVVDEIGLKQVAFDLDVAPSDISHALAGRERHYFRAEWAFWLMWRSKSDDAAAYPARARGLDVREPEELTDAQKVERLEGRLRQLGKVGETILGEAYGERAKRSRR